MKTNFDLGWCFFKLGNYDKALEYYAQAESFAARSGMAKNQLEALSSIGEVHIEQQDAAGAEHFLQRALAISRSLGDKSSVAMILNNLAIVSVIEGKLDAAEQYNHESLDLEAATHDYLWLNNVRVTEAQIQQARGNLTKAEELLSQVIGDSTADISLRWESETRLAEVFATQKRDRAAEAQWPGYRHGGRRPRRSYQRRVAHFFPSTASDFYNSYIDFLVAHGRARDALQVAEHSRARALSEGLGLRIGMSKASFKPELAAKRAHGVVLAYWLKNGRSYLWAVTPQRVEVFALPPAEQIENGVYAYSKELLGPEMFGDGECPWSAVVSMLVAPAKKQIAHGSHVTIVADGVLHTLNFETLLAPSPQLHYLIEDVELANAPSIGLLAASEISRKPANQKLLLIGNPLAANSNFPRLAQAKLEMETVEKHFAPQQCTTLEGGQATVRASFPPTLEATLTFTLEPTERRVGPLRWNPASSSHPKAMSINSMRGRSRPIPSTLNW